jgi:hypothetical protein
MKLAFWNVAPCSLVERDSSFRGAHCLYHHGNEYGTHKESGGDTGIDQKKWNLSQWAKTLARQRVSQIPSTWLGPISFAHLLATSLFPCLIFIPFHHWFDQDSTWTNQFLYLHVILVCGLFIHCLDNGGSTNL